MSRPEDTLYVSPLSHSPPTLTLFPPPSQPPRALLQRLRVPQIHDLVPHPNHPIRNDAPCPRAPSAGYPVPHPRHRVRLRPVGRDPVLRPPLNGRPARVGGHGHLGGDAGRGAGPRRGRRPAARGHRAGGAVPGGQLRRRGQHQRHPVAVQRGQQRRHGQGAFGAVLRRVVCVFAEGGQGGVSVLSEERGAEGHDQRRGGEGRVRGRGAGG